jgi:hypothetical protein
MYLDSNPYYLFSISHGAYDFADCAVVGDHVDAISTTQAVAHKNVLQSNKKPSTIFTAGRPLVFVPICYLHVITVLPAQFRQFQSIAFHATARAHCYQRTVC